MLLHTSVSFPSETGFDSRLIVTSDVAAVQGASETVQRNVLVPIPKPVTEVVGCDGLVIVPAPETNDQSPVPETGTWADKFTVDKHTLWPDPAFETGGCLRMISTVSFAGGQPGRVTVQINAFTPTDNPVTPEFRFAGVVTIPPPDKTDQAPVPAPGKAAPRVAVAAQMLWLLPASAETADEVMVTSSGEDPQPLVSVQRRTFAPADNPEIEVEKLDALANVALPDTTVQTPVFPVPGSFPARVAVVPQTV